MARAGPGPTGPSGALSTVRASLANRGQEPAGNALRTRAPLSTEPEEAQAPPGLRGDLAPIRQLEGGSAAPYSQMIYGFGSGRKREIHLKPEIHQPDLGTKTADDPILQKHRNNCKAG